MARLQLNKSSLARQVRDLKTYQRFLPSLDLKRQQLMAERAKALLELNQIETDIVTLKHDFGDRLPMLANEDVKLDNLVEIKDVRYGEENVVGIHLPTLDRLEVAAREYSRMATPHWVDSVVSALRDALELELRQRVSVARVDLLEAAVKTITQRVNLFEKVLIPRTQANIKAIKIYLSDEQMAAVVRSKISKNKRAATVPS